MMAYPPQYRDTAPLPSIAVPVSGVSRFRDHHVIPFARSPAMAIPGLDTQPDAPPPLPPPKVLPFGDAPAQRLDFKKERGFPRGPSSSSSFASGYGSMSPSCSDGRSGLQRDIGSLVSDEGYSSYASSQRARDSLPAEFGLHHNKFQFSAADLQDDCMKKKLNPIRTVEKSPPLSLLTSSISDLARHSQPDNRFNYTPSMPFQLPIHSRASLDALPRDPSAFSPRSTLFHQTTLDCRPHHDHADLDHSPRGRSRRSNSDDASTFEVFGEDTEMDETSSLKRLHIEDACAAAGQKRRAASPALEDPGSHGMVGLDVMRRRDGATRGSPTPRLSGPDAKSSVGIAGHSRSSIYLPNVSMSSSRSAGSGSVGHRSPGARSPGGISPTPSTSPYTTPSSLNHSPRAVASRAPIHARNVSSTCSSRKPMDIQKTTASKIQGFHMCDCCPKKPKKFETREELNAHEAEKQYECSFCGNRFKNKNEAERHQNSLHVRRHSWSCSALVGYYRAFHESTVRPGQADACGYCGEEFPRSGHSARGGALSGGMSIRHATDQDWDQRIRHLQETHKFRECNSSKKFYRADHFRQHLKHSHAGTSGKWTNMLENACLIEEEPTAR